MTDKEKDLIKKFAIYASREDSKKANVHHVNKHSNIVFVKVESASPLTEVQLENLK